MSEAVQFWLDNKMSTGIKVAGFNGQLLVLYRERYYLVENGAARMLGRRPLRYSKSSLPAIWKKALAGGADEVPAEMTGLSDDSPTAPGNRWTGGSMVETRLPEQVHEEIPKPEPAVSPAAARTTTGPKRSGKAFRPVKAPPSPGMVVARCPYCNTGHEIIPEKGRIGKPFFLECERCKAEFAVRIVPVMMYQAQVAGFR